MVVKTMRNIESVDELFVTYDSSCIFAAAPRVPRD